MILYASGCGQCLWQMGVISGSSWRNQSVWPVTQYLLLSHNFSSLIPIILFSIQFVEIIFYSCAQCVPQDLENMCNLKIV